MKAKDYPDQDTLRQMFEYNAETGDLIWRDRPIGHFRSRCSMKSWNTKYSGRIAGTINNYDCKRYVQLSINKNQYLAHRIVIAMHGIKLGNHQQVDHINGDGLDNRIENLRVVSSIENMRNVKISTRNTSGVTGVTFRDSRSKWQAQISVNNKCIFLGLYDNKDDAIAARKQAEMKYNFHENHGQDRPL